MDMWCEPSLNGIRRTNRVKSIIEKGWFGRLISPWRNGSEGASSMDRIPEQGEWDRQIQSLSEECDALRRKIHLS